MGVDEKTLILIDGHALAFRSYFALERTGMKTTSNQPTWAVFGFFKAIFDLLKNKNLKPDCIAVAFDVGRKTFRVEDYPEYKANRDSMPDTLRSQMELIFEGLRAFNIPIYTKEGFEADDVIGTIVDKAAKIGHKTLILTGDRDAFQLVDKQNFVKVIIPSKGEIIEYDWNKVFEKMGVYPNQVADLKGLAGDTSDNIPGIKGIGDKTAGTLLGKYGSIENIYEHLDEITQKALKEKLVTGKEIAALSKHLATIKIDVDVDFDFEHTHLELAQTDEIEAFFKKLQFYNFLKNIETILQPFRLNVPVTVQSESLQETEALAQAQTRSTSSLQLGLFAGEIEEASEKTAPAVSNQKFDKIIVNTKEKFEDLINNLKKHSLFAIDTETTSLNPREADLVGVSIAYNPCITVKNKRVFEDKSQNNVTKTFYIPTFHRTGEQLEMDFVLENLKPVLEDENICKTLQNAKFDANILRKYNININGIIFDTMLASYIKDPSRRHGLKIQANEHLDFMMQEIEELIGKGKGAVTFEAVTIEDACNYACDDAYATLELTRYWQNCLDEKELDLLYNIEVPLSKVLADMEWVGISIDRAYLGELSEELQAKISELEKKIHAEAGEVFNVNSPKQVGDVLFVKMGLKPPKGSKIQSGFSTNAKILEELAKENKICEYLLEQRHLSKLKSTYIDALPELIDPVDNRIHTSYNQTVTTTGRLSSSAPNLQNIPIRTQVGNRIRAAFVPKDKENYVILSADYSQIELRLLAHVSRDDSLIDAFCSDGDIHSLTAAKVFDVSPEEVTKDMRYRAKAVNFGIIYGQTRYGLASGLKITPIEAQNFIDKYFVTYPNVKKYMDETVRNAHEKGYVETMYGRKRYLKDELLSSNRQIKEFAERAAINQPLQGAAADLIKIAMIELHKKLVENNLKTKIILQVHDELVLEVLKSELEQVKALTLDAMELNQPLLVPLKIDVAISNSWMEPLV